MGMCLHVSVCLSGSVVLLFVCSMCVYVCVLSDCGWLLYVIAGCVALCSVFHEVLSSLL